MAARAAEACEAQRKALADAQKIVAIWNARVLWFYPTIGAAITAGLPWLSFSCDLCTLDRQPGASIST
jgi:hypothetical protein